MATISSRRPMGPRHPFEEYTRMIVWNIESGQELDETLVQHGLGLLLVAKSDQDSMFRLLLASIKSCEIDQEKQLRRALLRWAKGNQRAEAYPLVVLKAKTLPLDKVESIVDYFRSVPVVVEEAGWGGSEGNGRLGDGEGDETVMHFARGLRAARWVTRSLVRLLEGRMVTVAAGELGIDADDEAAPATVEAEEGELGEKGSELGIEKENEVGDDMAKESGEPEVNGKVNGEEKLGKVALKSTPSRSSVSGSVEAEVLTAPDNGSFVRGGNSCGSSSLKLDGKPTKSGLTEVVKSIVRKERGSISGAKLDGLLISGPRRVTIETDGSVPGRSTRTVGVQTPRRNEIGEVRTQLEKLAATMEDMALDVKGVTAQQTMMERRLGRPLQRLKDVVEHKIVPSLQVVQDNLKEHSQRLQRLEQGVRERNNPCGDLGSLDAIPVARVVDPNVVASNSSTARANPARRSSGMSRREVIGRPRARDDDSSNVMLREVFVMYDEDN